ncbi:cyclin-dependent kinase 18-like [Sinocyclocheilus rhinocerous]|uniref:cyclin-dependent kinase 18-like n=1 Tax=Sinocyclocheilus rhinocerous TaxID=307959 RepID=UPI0007BA817D|nr:PREDICTED: cyclin-dependent kinase 18-like [Sinocyclocheilus rhinocerous]
MAHHPSSYTRLPRSSGSALVSHHPACAITFQSYNYALFLHPYGSSRLRISLPSCEARRRMCAEVALRHIYFRDLGEKVQDLADTTSIFSVKEIRLQMDPGKHFPAQRELAVVHRMGSAPPEHFLPEGVNRLLHPAPLSS